MQDFIFYFKIGWKHILSWDATDHIYFITVLAVIYTFSDWKKILVLVTAFTLGHAITLYISALDLFRFSIEWVEFAIPCTIIVTAGSNLLVKQEKKISGILQYMLALCFGLVHGMGYANYIRMQLSKNQDMVWSLFSFNVGLEMGQLLVVLFVLSIQFIFMKYKLVNVNTFAIIISLYVLLVSFFLAVERFQSLSS